jgi:hypothetical protein
LVGGAVTLASAALPITLNVVTRHKRDEALALGTSHPEYPSASDDFRTFRTLYYVSYAVPAALAALTVTVAVVAARGKERRPIAIGVLPTDRGAQLRTSGAF